MESDLDSPAESKRGKHVQNKYSIDTNDIIKGVEVQLNTSLDEIGEESYLNRLPVP